VIPSYQVWSEHLVVWFPRIVSGGIPFPLDEVLEFAPSAEFAMPHDFLHFVFCLSTNQIWWWSLEIRTVNFGLMIRSQQGGVEDVMDGPGCWQLQSIGDR
jgi:hypothetical protein